MSHELKSIIHDKITEVGDLQYFHGPWLNIFPEINGTTWEMRMYKIATRAAVPWNLVPNIYFNYFSSKNSFCLGVFLYRKLWHVVRFKNDTWDPHSFPSKCKSWNPCVFENISWLLKMINWFWFDHITLKSNHQIFEEVYTYNTSWVYIFNTWEFSKSDRKKTRQTWYVTSGEKRKQKCQNELFSSYKLKQEKPVASSLCEKTAGRSGDIRWHQNTKWIFWTKVASRKQKKWTPPLNPAYLN